MSDSPEYDAITELYEIVLDQQRQLQRTAEQLAEALGIMETFTTQVVRLAQQFNVHKHDVGNQSRRTGVPLWIVPS